MTCIIYQLDPTKRIPSNIVGVAAGGSATAASDDTVLDVDGCSDISNLSKRFPSDSTRTCDERRLTSKINEGKVMIIPFKINFNDA